MRMQGTSKVDFETNDHMPKAMNLKRSDQGDETIGATSEFCDGENLVIFSRSGGAVFPDPDEVLAKQLVAQAERKTLFRREGGTYTLDMLIKKPKMSNRERKDAQKRKKQEAQEDIGRLDNGANEAVDPDKVMGISVVLAEAWEHFRKRAAEDFHRPPR